MRRRPQGMVSASTDSPGKSDKELQTPRTLRRTPGARTWAPPLTVSPQAGEEAQSGRAKCNGPACLRGKAGKEITGSHGILQPARHHSCPAACQHLSASIDDIRKRPDRLFKRLCSSQDFSHSNPGISHCELAARICGSQDLTRQIQCEISGLAHRDCHLADALERNRHHVAGLDRRYALAGSRHDDIARVERVDRRSPENLPGDADDHFARVCGLPQFAIDVQREIIIGIARQIFWASSVYTLYP